MTLATLVAHHLERQVSWGPGSEALSVREIFNTGQSYYQKELVQRVGILGYFANQCLLSSWSKRDLRFVVKLLWLRDIWHSFFFDPSCITSAPVVTQITAAHSSSLSSGSLSSCLLRLHLRQSTCFLIGQHSFPFTRESSTIPQSCEFQLFRPMLWWYVEDIFYQCCGDMLRIRFDPHLTLEALWMEVFVQCVDSWSLKNSMLSGCHNKRKAANRNNWKVI